MSNCFSLGNEKLKRHKAEPGALLVHESRRCGGFEMEYGESGASGLWEKQKKVEASYANSAIKDINPEITNKYGLSGISTTGNGLGVNSSRNWGNPQQGRRSYCHNEIPIFSLNFHSICGVNKLYLWTAIQTLGPFSSCFVIRTDY